MSKPVRTDNFVFMVFQVYIYIIIYLYTYAHAVTTRQLFFLRPGLLGLSGRSAHQVPCALCRLGRERAVRQVVTHDVGRNDAAWHGMIGGLPRY